ncbi:MAG: malate dehydrogenase [Nitrosopumilus sp.]|jgi:malate dehydrogenase|nr:malate dehydrogenase [Nitrosopumilaceae archaeon]MBA4459214.1 malate dehydrogenase [Nitrosopumilaceae archaeon]RMW34326.1 MAG: malate dehydrogenase [Nitrosopumilus sp.]RMW37080.1 MAG: malate dehydrogenase [Nitrosopumilus sp.]RMW38358.1 MAG: malate dehydrogenase [Nitrosopumilus sp.]
MITIIGSGKVGGDAALFSALKRLDDQILLLDVAEGLPQGEAMDINHMLSEQGIDVEVKGSNNFEDMKGSNIVVVVAGSGRKPGMTRMDLLKINASIVKSVVENVKKYADDSMIIPVTNPLDPMAYITYKVSGFDRSRVFGMGGMLDLSRFRQFIHEATGHSRDSIRALVIGEHGENMLPLPRFSSVSGIPLPSLLPKEKLDELVQNTKQVAAKVIELKGATVHAPGNAISAIVESVVRDRKQVIPVATYLDGEYGHSDVTIGVPAVIGKKGVEKIIELDLNDEEKQVFNKAVENVKGALSGVEI